MNTMAPTRASELHACRVRLATGPAAAAEARGQVRAAIRAWHVPVDPDIAALLTSDLVTDTVRREAGGTIVLTVRCARGELRVDVHGTARSWPGTDPMPTAEIPRGLILVATLSAAWGGYRTPAGNAVYFTLPFQPAGVYLDHWTLREGIQAPPADRLLALPDVVDLVRRPR